MHNVCDAPMNGFIRTFRIRNTLNRPIFALCADHIFVFMVLCGLRSMCFGPNFFSSRCVNMLHFRTNNDNNVQQHLVVCVCVASDGRPAAEQHTIVRYTLVDNILTKPIPAAHKLLCFACVCGAEQWIDRCEQLCCVLCACLTRYSMSFITLAPSPIFAAQARDSCFDLGFYTPKK